MQVRIADLKYREVINVVTGLKLGYAGDVVLDAEGGRVTALVVPGPYRFFGIFGRGDDYIIPWECIRKIGDDIVTVEISGEYRREKPARRFLFF